MHSSLTNTLTYYTAPHILPHALIPPLLTTYLLIPSLSPSELKTALVGQIARILALYEVDEVVVFIDSGYEQAGDPEKVSDNW